MRLINHAEGECCTDSILSESPTVGGAAWRVSQGQSHVEREQFLLSLSLSLSLSASVSLTPDSVSHHMWLSVDISPTQSDRLCFSLSHFKWGLAGILCQSRPRQNCQNTLLNFGFWRIFFADDMCWEACNSILPSLHSSTPGKYWYRWSSIQETLILLLDLK